MSTITGAPPVEHEPPPPPPHKRHPGLWIGALAAVAVVVAVGAGIGIGASVGQKTRTATSSSSHATTQPSQPATQTPPQESVPPAPSGPITLNLGESLIIAQNGTEAATLTITRVDVTTQPPDQYSGGPANGYFVIAHVKIHVRNDYTEGFYINPFDFYAVVNGQHYEYGNGNALFLNGTLSDATLGAGERTSGNIVFDVPATHGEIAYAPNYSGGPIAFWRFPGSGMSV